MSPALVLQMQMGCESVGSREREEANKDQRLPQVPGLSLRLHTPAGGSSVPQKGDSPRPASAPIGWLP